MHTVAELGSGWGWGPTLTAQPAWVGLSTVVVQTGVQRLSEARAASSKCGPRSDFISATVARTGPRHPRFLLPQSPGNYISQHPLHWGWGPGLTEGRDSHRAWAQLPVLRRPLRFADGGRRSWLPVARKGEKAGKPGPVGHCSSL